MSYLNSWKIFGCTVAELFAANTVAIWFPNAIDDLQLTSPKLAVGWNNLRLDASTDAPHKHLAEHATNAKSSFCRSTIFETRQTG